MRMAGAQTCNISHPLHRGAAATGFMQSRVRNRFLSIALLRRWANALLIARAISETLASSQKPLDILVTATASGLDVDVRGHGALDDKQRQALVRIALELDLARLSNHGEVFLTQRMPLIAMGKAMAAPPSGAFLQATEAGEEVLASRVCAQIAGLKRIADLFSGIGTFALRMAEFAAASAFDLDEGALSVLG
jgi:23S rRNA (uracil1939-C5)-methyltransferase